MIALQHFKRFIVYAMLLLPTLCIATAGNGQTNLALGKVVTASSTEASGLEAGNAVDGNSSTRWSSAYSDPQWIQVDLGATYNISRVVLRWEAAYASGYQVQVSSNGSSWTTIYSTSTGNGAVDDLTGLSGSGRYLRMYGTQRATPWGYSLFELEVNGSQPPPPATNLALGKPAVSSTTESSLVASNVNDGSTSTRWSSLYSDPQWVQIDLGASYSISSVVLHWEAAYGRTYQIQVSANGTNWTSIYSTSTGDGATDLIGGLSGTGRYIRMYGTQRGTAYGYSLFEMEVYGTAAGGGVTTHIEAENYTAMSGIVTEPCSEGGLNVGYVEPGDWMDYSINTGLAGNHNFSFRVACPFNNVQMRFQRGTTILGTINLPNTGGWQSYQTVTTTMSMVAGAQTFRITTAGSVTGFQWNLNWFEFTPGTGGGGGDTQAPSVPAGLTAGSIGQTGFTLSWNASTDNVGVTAYEVSRNGTVVGTTAATSLAISGLTCNSSHAMRVRARDAAGNWSALSNTLNVTTAACTGGGFDLSPYTLFRDYNFGTASGNNVSNITQLANAFNPYGIAGTTVINGEWQRYQNFNTTNHVFAANDLELTSLANLGGIYAGGISSGQIATKETFYPRNGRTYVFQVRVKIPNKRGSWPAFWMYAKQAPNTPSEIDIFEFFNTPTQNEYDWTGYDHGDGVGSNYYNIMTNQWVWHPGTDFSAAYHTYTLVWKEGDIQKWVDGTQVKGTYFNWFGSDPQVIINLAIGGSSNYNPDASSFPCKFLVDYFRVYYRDAPGGNTAQSGTSDGRATAEESNRSDFMVYPNPSQHEISLQIPAEFSNGNLVISTAAGQPVYTRKISTRLERMDLTGYKKGIYFITLKKDGKTISQKLIIQD